MEITVVQIAALAVGLFFMYNAYVQYRKKIFDSSDLAVWAIVWGGLIAASLFSGYVAALTTIVWSYRIIDLASIFAIVLLFALQFHFYKQLRLYQKKTEELVRQKAFESAKEPPSKRA